MITHSHNKWINPDKDYKKCPVCLVGRLDKRIPRNFIFKYVLFWKDVKRYKCNNCGTKVYTQTNRETEEVL